jgi:hypothetical protein
MASTRPIERTEPVVVPRGQIPSPVRSRLPAPLKVAILIVLNFGFRGLLWTFTETLLNQELGAVSKVPEVDFWSQYSVSVRACMTAAMNIMTWYFNYDCKTRHSHVCMCVCMIANGDVVYDAAALTVLTNAPYAYLLVTYYDITIITTFAHTLIEVLAIAIPTYLLRARSTAHSPNAPLRNRFLLNSVQVQFSSSLLAMGVYVVVLWAGLKTDVLNVFLVGHFDIPNMMRAHAETPVSIWGKIFVAGVAAKEFLLNPSIAAQPASTPVEELFDPVSATLDQTIKANVLPVERRARKLVQQAIILNAFTFASTVQRCMTLAGTDITGATGYAGVWVLANSVIALWYVWVGDTSSDYEPL